MHFDVKNMRIFILVALCGFLLGWLVFAEHGIGQSEESVSKEPLYWVAPMDPNYRRDEPGKSPMGMDLIPVYEEEVDETSVKISPAVINNLGVKADKATYRKLHPSIRTVGYVKYDEDKLIHIHPRVEGWIETLFVKSSGDEVKKGDPLYALYSPQLVNAQEEYLSALSRGNNSLIQAAESRLRSLQLSAGFISKLKKHRKVAQTVIFNSPQTGVVDNLNIREGFYVKPGTSLMSVGALDEVWVEAEIFERQASLVKENLPVEMTLDFLPGRKWNGVVDYVYPTLDVATRTVRIRLRFKNDDLTLKPNMFAQVLVLAGSDENLLTVPREAVIRTGSESRVVLALGDGRFKSVPVSLGRQDDEFISILSGIKDGDEVVTSAQFLIDSESSKAADFNRMAGAEISIPEMKKPDTQKSSSAETIGKINAVDSKARIVNISRGAIEKWNRPPATLDFQVAEDVDISHFAVGKELEFRFEVSHGEFVIVELPGMEAPMDHEMENAHD